MVRNYKRKTAHYDEEKMRQAVQLVQSNAMGYKKAAKLCGVNLSTLKDQAMGKRKKMGAGREPRLSKDIEEELAKCIELFASWGFGMGRSEVIEVVREFVNHEFPDMKMEVTREWMDSFLKRHPTLTLRKPEQLKKTRVKAITAVDDLQDFYKLFETECTKNNLLNNPDRLYNVDETGFPLDPTRSKVLAEKGARNLFRVIGGSGREQITVNGCCNAADCV